LIQLKQFPDGFLITPLRRIQQLAALVHFFFFSVGGSASFHSTPSSSNIPSNRHQACRTGKNSRNYIRNHTNVETGYTDHKIQAPEARRTRVSPSVDE
jgi:hypothetical protein